VLYGDPKAGRSGYNGNRELLAVGLIEKASAASSEARKETMSSVFLGLATNQVPSSRFAVALVREKKN
jgi:hypothetical protein